MDNLSSELLSIFKRLNSVEMVKVMSVCRSWLVIIDDSKSLWRSLVLPEKEKGWKPSVLILFDQKCQSTLKEVSMRVKQLDDQDADAFCEVLVKSKDTLQTIECSAGYEFLGPELSASFLRFPNLKIFIQPLMSSGKVELCERLEFESQDEALNSSGYPKLRVLWPAYPEVLVNSSLPFITNLVSLSLEDFCSSSWWKRVLKGPSQTLKHLKMQVIDGDEDEDEDDESLLLEEETEISSMTFPKLKVLEFSSFRRSDEPPQWMDTPSISVLITNARKNSLLSSSSLSTLWIEEDVTNLSELIDDCPLLSELRIGKPTRKSEDGLPLADLVNLFGMLQWRSRQADARPKVDGAQFRQIRTLVLPSGYFKDNNSLVKAYISNLRELVEEVVDFESESRIIKVEI